MKYVHGEVGVWKIEAFSTRRLLVVFVSAGRWSELECDRQTTIPM